MTRLCHPLVAAGVILVATGVVSCRGLYIVSQLVLYWSRLVFVPRLVLFHAAAVLFALQLCFMLARVAEVLKS